jgi:serine/threonine protein kinase
MGKTRKNYRNKSRRSVATGGKAIATGGKAIATDGKAIATGGKVIASGGYGCVFNPALKCEGQSKRESNKISKLMTDRHATEEYEEIKKIKEKLDSIDHYEDYFLIYDATLCRPSKLTDSDLKAFGDKCSALPKDGIRKKNINSKLNEVMALNIPNGGLAVDDYVYSNGSYKKLYETHIALVNLLKKGIIPMNKKNIYHSDIKDSNILIDDKETSLKTRLIDWGLTVEYTPGSTETFPKNWRNRPLQFNVPFSVVIFTDLFYEMYTKYLKDGGKIEEASLKPFVINYLNKWMKERGAGHYKFINEIIFLLYSNTLTTISHDNKPDVIETEITMPYIIDSIIDVLLHYTKFKSDGSLNLREYLDEVYIQIVDIWGFITAYFPLLEMFGNNYFKLNENELKIFKQLQYIFNKYLYKHPAVPINLDQLYADLNILGNLIHVVSYGKINNDKRNTTSSDRSLIGGIKTRKNGVKISQSQIFKRKKFRKHFKKPFFLSISLNINKKSKLFV